MSNEIRRLAFAHLDQLQTALVNEHDGWRKVPTEIRGHVESLRQITEACIPPDPTAIEQVVLRTEGLILRLPTAERAKARRVVARRMMHPEGATIDTYYDPHPKQRGGTASSWDPTLCVRCNRSEAQHDIDGLNDQCDGWVAP